MDSFEPLIYEFATREAWLAARAKGIGASEAAGVLGEAPPQWASPWKIWAEKTEGRSLDDGIGEAAEWGLAFERTIAERFAIRSRREVQLPPIDKLQLYVHPEHEWMRATPDAFQWPRPDETWLPDGEPGVLQVKCAGEYKREEWQDGQTPLWYDIQVQWEMAVTGCRWGSLIVLIGGNRLLGPFDRLRSDGFLEAIHPHMAAFWRSVRDRTPPPLDGSQATAKAIKQLYKEDEGEVVNLDDSAEEAWHALREVKQKAKALKEEENRLKAVVIDKMRTASVGLLPSGGRLTYRTVPASTYEVNRKPYRVLKGPNE